MSKKYKEYSEENYIETSPILTIENHKKIINQMEKKICRIIINNYSKGSGFFCKIPLDNRDFIGLVTCHHFLNKESIYANNIIIIELNNGEVKKEITIDESRVFYTKEEYDITIVEIIPDDKIDLSNCLELDNKYYDIHNYERIYEKQLVYVLHYPNGDECLSSYGNLNVVQDSNKYKIHHYCSTKYGSSGSPIILLNNLKVIGIHIGGLNKHNINVGNLNILYTIILY